MSALLCPRVSQVLSVGKLYNPDVRYSFNIPIEDKPQQFFWDAYGPWQECSSLCQGEGEASEPGDGCGLWWVVWWERRWGGGERWRRGVDALERQSSRESLVWINLAGSCYTTAVKHLRYRMLPCISLFAVFFCPKIFQYMSFQGGWHKNFKFTWHVRSETNDCLCCRRIWIWFVRMIFSGFFSGKLKSQKGKFSMLNRQIVVMWC